jgi:hypothetical protein
MPKQAPSGLSELVKVVQGAAPLSGDRLLRRVWTMPGAGLGLTWSVFCRASACSMPRTASAEPSRPAAEGEYAPACLPAAASWQQLELLLTNEPTKITHHGAVLSNAGCCQALGLCAAQVLLQPAGTRSSGSTAAASAGAGRRMAAAGGGHSHLPGSCCRAVHTCHCAGGTSRQ